MFHRCILVYVEIFGYGMHVFCVCVLRIEGLGCGVFLAVFSNKFFGKICFGIRI